MSQRVADSFGNGSISAVVGQGDSKADHMDRRNLLGDVKDYSQQLYSSWSETSKSLNRNALLVLGLMAIFEILAYQSKTKEFVIGPISFANTSIVQIVLPAAIAYMVYDTYLLSARVSDMENAYTAIMRQFASKISTNGLDFLVAPLLRSFWSPTNQVPAAVARRSDRFREGITSIFGLVALVVVPAAFEIQAFYHLFDKFGFRNPLLWISASITTALACCSVAFITLDTAAT